MRHRKSRNLFNRSTSLRKAILKSMVRSLLAYQSIKTTLGKAKALQPFADKLITIGKTDNLTMRREAFSILGSHQLVTLLFSDIAKRFEKKVGGYTRIMQLGDRRGDGAALAIIELTEIKKKEVKKHKKDKAAKAHQEKDTEDIKEKTKHTEEKKLGTEAVVKEKPPVTKKPAKKFLGGLKNIFKKERDSL